ncbi:MAG: folate-binding protein [Anaeromyxobacter sp.]|nr:folate-binding protein [Anaeromyxobacter sp.]
MTPTERLESARSALAVGPLQARALLRATGRDAHDYLHRMCTQVVNGLAPGRTTYACFLTAKGHLLGEGHLLGLEDGVLLDLDPRSLAETKGLLEKFVIMDEVVFEDLSETHAVVPLTGGALAAGPGGEPAVALAAAVATLGVWAHQNGRRGAPGLDLVAPLAVAERLRAALLAAGAAALDEQDLEILRVEGGFARFGQDMDGSRLPMEAGLTRAGIAFDKGCYIGQEVVLRATQRGQIQKGLVQLALPAAAGPGSPLSVGGVEVGAVTSAVDAPSGRLGLGYLRRAHWAEGTRVATAGGEAVVRRLLVTEPEQKAGV